MAQSIIDANEAELDLKETQAELGEAIQPVNTALTNLKTQALQAITPLVKSLADGFMNLYNWLKEHPTILIIVTAVVIALAAAFGVLAVALSIQALINGVTKAFSLLNLTLLTNPIVLVVAAIAGLVAAFIFLWNKCDAFRNFWIAAWEIIKSAASTAWTAISGFFASAWAVIQPIWAWAKPYFIAIWEGIKTAASALWEAIKGFFTAAWTTIQTEWAAVKPYFIAIWDGIKIHAAALWAALVSFFSAAWTVIQSIWSAVQPYFSAIWEGIKAVFAFVAPYLSAIFSVAWSLIKGVWGAATGFFSAIWESIKGVFAVVAAVLHGNWSDAWTAIKGIVSTWRGYFYGIWTGIRNVFANIKTWFSTKFTEAWTAIKEVFSGWSEFFSGLWTQISTTFSTLGTTLSDAIGSAIKTGLNSVLSWIEGTINDAVNMINGAIDIINKVPGVDVGHIEGVTLPRFAKGGIVTSPTLAEIGEDGAEAVVPLENNTEWIREVARKMNGFQSANNSPALLSKLDDIYRRLDRLQIVLDTGTLVGETIDSIDRRLATRQTLKARGV